MHSVVILDHLTHFNVTQILESGQVFTFDKIAEHSYILNVKQKLIKLTQQPESSSVILYNTNISELDEIWERYFDIKTDYNYIAHTLSKKDPYIAEAVAFGRGIRILRQDPWEMLISFILSQNKAIPHIKQCIYNLSEKYGKPIEPISNEEKHYYTFPTAEELIKATEEDLRACKVGFRASYIKDACQKIMYDEVNLNDLMILPTEEARQKLMTIKGVGPKIADCILLFAYGRSDVFPIDVWIKRVIEGFYFKGKEMKLEQLQKFAKDYFGDLAGYAQQYLFYYGRQNMLFKTIEKEKHEKV